MHEKRLSLSASKDFIVSDAEKVLRALQDIYGSAFVVSNA